MPASTLAPSPLPEKNHEPGGQPGLAVGDLIASLEKSLEAGQTLRREDYLRLFVAYYGQSKTRQDQGYGLNTKHDHGQGHSQPPLQT